MKMYKISKSSLILSISLIVIGLLSSIYAFIDDAHAAWTSLVFNNYFFLAKKEIISYSSFVYSSISGIVLSLSAKHFYI